MAVHSPLPKSMAPERVRDAIDAYADLQGGGGNASLEARKERYAELVRGYYDLVTDFYEYGWGRSFHFATRRRGESLQKALARHQQYLAERLGLTQNMRVLDVGCGVGGPMREIAAFSGASVIGVNNNAYQLAKCERYNRDSKLSGQCSLLNADFMSIPCADDVFDAIYAIEATCHAADRKALFTELKRLLRPGGLFAGYEWCLTNAFDAADKEHVAIKDGIVRGSGLPDLTHWSMVDEALIGAGFELLEARDVAAESDPPWYSTLQGRDLSLSSILRTGVGQRVTHMGVRLLETLCVAPAGATDISNLLMGAGRNLVAGGVHGTFTPMYFFMARKPASCINRRSCG
jgi:sterol 24-C-methyltransferase